VCWNADRSAIVRDAGTITEGERVHVKLERGELDCDVAGHGGTETRSKTN
jgi:hypothetical protein